MAEQLLRGHYQIIRTLSSGGFGQTYLAHDTDIPGNPICVVKQLKPLTQTPNHLEVARQLFEREAQKLTILGKHDQIPRLLAYFKENDEFYLVQEYVEGHTLDAELPPSQRWTEAQVIDLLQQMLSVLVYVHDEGVIHRDIKPTNIIRRQQDNKLVLIDFGAVKEVAQPGGGPGAVVTVATGTQIGTAGYMPTEQGRGKPKPSSDLYALGMIGIQALTGRYPHQLEEDPNTGEIIWQPLTQVSPGLATVLTQMTRYHFKDRYQSAVEALQAVRQLVSSSTTARPGVAPTVTATQIAMESVHELTLTWTEAGQVRSQVIRPQQATKFPGRVRVGRDPAQCDIVLSHPTVSALHVEILFQPQQQFFLMRNLREKNPPYVNGQLLTQGEVALNQGSVVRLGEAEFQVASVALKQYPVDSVPSASFATPQYSSPQPVAPTVQTESNYEDAVKAQPLNNSPLFLYIPVWRLIILSVISFGVYETYWFYKNWQYLKEREGLTIQPFWRAIFGILFCHRLLYRIRKDKAVNSIKQASFSSNLLATVWVFWSIISTLMFGQLEGMGGPGPAIYFSAVFIFSSLCLVPVQNHVNSATKIQFPHTGIYKWSMGHTLCLLLGVANWILLYMPSY